MTHVRPRLISGVLFVLALSGCGSCQPPVSPPPSTARPDAGAAAVPPTVPTGAAAVPADSGRREGDCFVYVDADPDFGDAPLTAHFTTEVDCGNKTVTYRWDFGDGTSGGNEPNPSHEFQKDGEYLVTVTVTAPDGATGSDEIDIYVDEKD